MANVITDSLLLDSGMDQKIIDKGNKINLQLLHDTGFPNILEGLDGNNQLSNKRLQKENESYWGSILENFSEWAVGEDADWSTYWTRGLGKTNINLMLQYHTKGKKGIDWKKAMEAEPEDTGALERAFETIVSLGGDTPTFLAGGLAGGYLSGGNPFGAGFGAGFLNDSIKGMYYEALHRGDVENFQEWWDIFLKHGVTEGIKGGITVGTLAVAPNALTAMKIPVNMLTKFGARWSALTGVGAIMDGQLPDKDTMVNNALILGAFGFIEPKASKMVNESTKKNKTEHLDVIENITKDVSMKEDIASKNIKTFRKDKKLTKETIQELKTELKELNKLDKEVKPKIVETKEIAIEKLERKIESLSLKIKEAKTTSVKDLNRTKLEIAEKELLEVKEGKVLEAKNIEKFEAELRIKLEKELADMNIRAGEIIAEINGIKRLKKNDKPYDKDRLRFLQNEIKAIQVKAKRNKKIIDKDKRIVEIEQKLNELGEPIRKVVEKDKQFEKSKDKDIESLSSEVLLGKTKMEKGLETWQSNFMKTWIDRLTPIFKAVEEAKARGVNVRPLDVYKRMRISMGNIGKGFHWIKYGTLDFKTLKNNGKSLQQILKKVIKNPLEYKEFSTFAIAKRAMEKFEQGIETGFSLTKKQRDRNRRIIKNHEAKYGEIFREINLYQQRLLTYLKDSGVLSKELYTRVLELNRDFVPFNRVVDLTVKDASLGTMVKNPLRKLEGSEKRIIDPIETMMMNTLHFVQIAEKNLVNKQFIEMVLDAQKAKTRDIVDIFADIKEVKRLKPIKVSKSELKDIIVDNKGVTENLKAGMTIFRKDSHFLGETQIAVFIDGKMKVYEVGKEFATTLKDMNANQSNALFRILSVPTRTLRAGATLDPAFTIKNMIRDTFFAGVFSKNTFIPIWDTIHGIFWIGKNKWRGNEMYEKFTKSGAMQSQLLSFDRNYFRDGQMLSELTGRNVHNAIKPKNWLETLRIVSEMAESGTRVKDFAKTLKRLEKENAKLPKDKKMTEREMLETAGFEARDLSIDFRKMGNGMQGLNMISAFFNARVQGLVKIAEGIKDPKRRGRILWNASKYITLPSVLLWYKNKDSQVYKDLPQWQKDLFWIYISNEGTEDQVVWRIPKPFEIGWVFGTFPERMLDWMYHEDKDFINSSKEFAGDFVSSMSPVPDFMRPFIEDSANENFFMERPIVPYAMEKILPEYQYTEYTSETAKLVAGAFAKLRDGLGMQELLGPSLDSPAKVDNYIKAWTAGLGQYVVSILDHALIATGNAKPIVKPWSDNWVKNLADMPIIKAFVVRHPSASSENITKFWKLYKPIARKVESYEYLMSNNKINEAMKVWDDIDPELLYLIDMAGPIKEMGDTIQLILSLDDIPPNEKRQLIDDFYRDMIDIAKSALEVKESLKK